MKQNKKTLSIVKAMGVLVFFLAAILLLGSAVGCGWRKPPKPEMITFHFKPDDTTNDGQPVYVVIRTVNKKQFLIEDYDEIANAVYADPPDKNLLAWHTLLPGKKEKIQVEKPEDAAIGVYALFTKPGENWKVMLKTPLESKYKLMLNQNVLRSKND